MHLSALSVVDRRFLLEAIGAEQAADLFAPHGFSPLPAPAGFPPGMSEHELTNRMRSTLASVATPPECASFLGGGIYHHFIPAAVADVADKPEFTGSYLPLHPEISQGILTVLFEYQTYMRRLTGLFAACCPVGSPGQALAGAILATMRRMSEGGKVLVAETVNPVYLSQASWLLAAFPFEMVTVPCRPDGSLDLAALSARLDGGIRAVVFQSPNHLGVIENLPALGELTRSSQAVLIQVIGEALSLGLLKPPGELGVDIACGEAQSLGIPPAGGGFSTGFVAGVEEFALALPGRLVAETEDMEGARAYVELTREYPSMRPFAHLFSDNPIGAVCVTAYLALMGGRGVQRAARLSHDRARLARRLAAATQLTIPTAESYFNEFVVDLDVSPNRLADVLLEERMLGGIPLQPENPDNRHYLFAFTEMNLPADIERLMNVLGRL